MTKEDSGFNCLDQQVAEHWQPTKFCVQYALPVESQEPAQPFREQL